MKGLQVTRLGHWNHKYASSCVPGIILCTCCAHGETDNKLADMKINNIVSDSDKYNEQAEPVKNPLNPINC